jgi:N-acetylglucosamine-6-sulfatase
MEVDYRAVRTDRYKYIHWVKFPDQDELYDLRTDSLERHNVARDPAMAAVRARMRGELRRLVVEAVGIDAP